MARIDAQTNSFFSQLSQSLKLEALSPEQVTHLSAAVAALKESTRLTKSGVDSLSDRLGLTEPHKATLIFALLLQRNPELKKVAGTREAMAAGLGGMLDAILVQAQRSNDEAISTALQHFFEAFAGPRAEAKDSGLEPFVRTPPQVTCNGERDAVDVVIQPSLLAPSLTALLGLTAEPVSQPVYGRRGVPLVPTYTAVLEQDAEHAWALRTMTPGQPAKSIPLSALGIESLELLSQGLAIAIAARPAQSGAQASPKEAIKIARDVRLMGHLLETAQGLIESKESALQNERRDNERTLRQALGDYRVARIGDETSNALVAALFPAKEAQ